MIPNHGVLRPKLSCGSLPQLLTVDRDNRETSVAKNKDFVII